MLHLLKYQFLQTIRSRSIMFWALAFPLILGTLFYVSFGNTGLAGTGETDWEPVPVAIVTVESSSANAASFLTFLNETDQDMIDIHSYKTEKAAKKALRREEISGIYYVKSVPSLTIASNGINQSILSSLLDSYEKNADMIRDIATQHPEKLSDALSSLNDYQTLVKEKSLGGHSLDPTLTYFLALIAFACLSGVYLSIHSTVQLQANLSALGERRSITPTHKLSLILGDLLVLESIHFVNILILELYLTQVLHISLGHDIPKLLLITFMGTLIGICLGILIGCAGKLSYSVKSGIGVLVTLLPSFLAGLMFGGMKNVIEHQNFYSVGLGWLMSEEEWMKGIEWLDMLKLKGSWGTLGNQNLDRAYPAEPLLSNAYSAVFGTPSAIYPGYQLAYLPNPNLRWEKVEAWEVGAEANFFRNRLHFEGVYYKKKTKDLLAEVPGISGTVPGIGNLGSIENLGVELALSWRDQIGDWNYNVGANLTTIKNKVLSLVQDGYSIIAGDKSQSYTMAGYPIGYFYGYKVEGVYQTQEEINSSPKNTLATVTPGDLKFKDVNGDGEITTADRTMIGDPTPNVTYGITLGVGYKNWELAVDMMGQGGNQIYRTWDNYNWSQFNFMAQRMDRWHGEGTSNTQPLLNTKHTINNMNSEYYIEDGSFFRIRNVSLAYNFDKALISKIGMQALKLYVNIQNLKTWKHNTGYTPELGGSAIAFGVDDGSYPMPAIYTFGFNLTF